MPEPGRRGDGGFRRVGVCPIVVSLQAVSSSEKRPGERREPLVCLDRSSSGHPIPIPACRWSARCDVMRCDALARRGQSIPDSPACNCSNRRRPVERGEASIGRPASHAPKQCPSPPPSPSLSLSPTWASPTDPSEHGRVRKASSDHCAHTDTAGPSVASRAQFCFLLPGRGRDACTGARAHGHRARQRGMGRGAADRSGRGRGWSVDGSRLRARRGRRCVPWARGRALSSIDPYQPCGIDGTRAHGPPAGAVASLHAAPSNGDGQVAGGDGGVSAWTHCAGDGVARDREALARLGAVGGTGPVAVVARGGSQSPRHRRNASRARDADARRLS